MWASLYLEVHFPISSVYSGVSLRQEISLAEKYLQVSEYLADREKEPADDHSNDCPDERVEEVNDLVRDPLEALLLLQRRPQNALHVGRDDGREGGHGHGFRGRQDAHDVPVQGQGESSDDRRKGPLQRYGPLGAGRDTLHGGDEEAHFAVGLADFRRKGVRELGGQRRDEAQQEEGRAHDSSHCYALRVRYRAHQGRRRRAPEHKMKEQNGNEGDDRCDSFTIE